MYENRVFRFGRYYIWFLGGDEFIFFSKTFYSESHGCMAIGDLGEEIPLKSLLTFENPKIRDRVKGILG